MRMKIVEWKGEEVWSIKNFKVTKLLILNGDDVLMRAIIIAKQQWSFACIIV